jgi:hypothetical protein
MWLPLLAALFASAADSAPVYDGGLRALTVAIPRFPDAIVIDGVMDEAVWSRAARLTGFSHFQPIDQVAAEDSTEIRVWYGPTAIYFGVRAREPHGEVHATLADRDRIFADDYVQFLLGTFNDGRQAFLFAVNPLGVQADGVLVERGVTAQGGYTGGTGSAREAADLSPDYVFESKGRLVEGGYEIEVGIPFKSLRYQSKERQTWRLHVLRTIQHAGYEDSWVPAARASASFLGQAGLLTGLSGLQRGLALDLTPEVTGRYDGVRTNQGRWKYSRAGPELGGTARWGISNDLSLNLTANPDFSQVESDVTQIQFDPRDAIYFPEKRPFFLDGLELFQTPNTLVYTRRIVQPTGAVKLSGKAFGADVGLISALDDRAASASGTDHPFVNVLRFQHDVGARSKLGLVYTDRIDGGDWNRVGAVDGRLVFGRNNLAFQVGQSGTRQSMTRVSGPLWFGRFVHSGRLFSTRYDFSGIDPDFRAQSGFIRRAGDVDLGLVNILTLAGRPGSLVERFTPDVSLYGTWTYDLFTAGRGVRDQKLHVNLHATLRGGWEVGTSILLEKFGYDPRLYADYRLEIPGAAGQRDTVPFRGVAKIPNRDYVLSLGTPEFRGFSASAFLIWGQDENFFEWASGNILFGDFGVNWRPTNQLRIEARYQHNQYMRRTDGTIVGRQRVPRLKLEYQIARPLFVRLVGEYNAYQQDSLHDDTRTNAPILIYDPSVGTYVRTAAFQNNTFRGDVLLSFTPVPGTVFFAGYGSTLEEPAAFRFHQMQRRADGFFLKGSYLFRVGS